MAKVTFQVQTQWQNGDGFKITSTGKNFQIGGQTVERHEAYTLASDYPEMSDLKGEKTTPELETTAIDNPLYQGTTFEYENLDNSL